MEPGCCRAVGRMCGKNCTPALAREKNVKAVALKIGLYPSNRVPQPEPDSLEKIMHTAFKGIA